MLTVKRGEQGYKLLLLTQKTNMAWNPETSSWELPPTSNLTTPPPELFPPESPPDGVCANMAQPGDVISIAYPNETQVVYTIVGDVEMSVESDVRSMEYDAWGKITFSDHWWYPQTMDTPFIEQKIYSPPALQIPMPSGVTPDMVTDNMISCGSSIEATAGLACAMASLTDFNGIEKHTCYHEDNSEEAESAWAGLKWPETIDVTIRKTRTILSIYLLTITFPFSLKKEEPPFTPVLASLALLALLMGAAGAGANSAQNTRRKHL